jgi:hypothetical protein
MENSEVISKIESVCCLLDSKSCNLDEIQKMNKLLTDFMSLENFKFLKLILFNSNSLQAKFYAANSLINITTEYYLTVEISEKIEIYEFIFNYLVKIYFNSSKQMEKTYYFSHATY